MGLKDLWERYVKKREDYAIEMKAGETAIRTYGDAKLLLRIEEYDKLDTEFTKPIMGKWSPLQKIDALTQRLDKMNLSMKKATFPYLRALNEPAFNDVLGAWELLRALSMNDMLVFKEDYQQALGEIDEVLKGDKNKRKRREQITILNVNSNHQFAQMERFLNEVLFRHGWKIMDAGHSDKDVSESYVNVIQTFGRERRLQGTEN